jgi:transketolase
VTQNFDDIDQLAVTTIRTLSMDAIERAGSGHPGAPMGLAPVAYVLYSKILKHDPVDPGWPDRDRFVLSCGHASMLLYSVLHLMGYDLALDEIKNFRQWESKTPGHPEVGVVPGVEMTTGPLGQGVATSVGMALAEAHLAATFNRSDHAVIDHHTWALCSDGDLMEGVSSEAASLAGHLKLGKLVWIWDDNRITIEGSTELSVSDDIPARFGAHGWRVLEVEDANDLEALAEAFDLASAGDGRPTLVRVRSHIAYGAPSKQDTAGAHGAPLGADEVRATKAAYGWPEEETFLVPPEVRERCRQNAQRGTEARKAWQEVAEAWATSEPELASEWQRRLERRLPIGWASTLPAFEDDAKIATRAASGTVLNAVAREIPELIGGSADLAPSNKTLIAGADDALADSLGNRNLRFGIREHAMGAVLNGLALHGGVRPYGGTFLVFSDYMRPAIRLAALMEQPSIYVFTHDSVWVGEDGPTHQPVEHLLALRAIPDLVVLRPADANETAAAWKVALERTAGPTALLLSRQGLPVLKAAREKGAEGVARGAYILSDAAVGAPAVVLIATGGEISLAVAAAAELLTRGIEARVVSMPSWELFSGQPEEYRREVLPPSVPRLAVEAGVTLGWRDIVGDNGAVIGIDRFGASAPGAEVAERFGLTVEAVVEKTVELVGDEN